MLLEQQKIEDEYYLEENQTESFPSNNCDFGTSHDFGNKLISDSCVINTRDHDDLYFAANSIGVDSNSGKYSISSYSNYNATEGNSHQKSSAELALEMRSDRQKLFQSSPAAVKTANKSSITPYLAAESELETTKFHHPILNDQEMVVARQKMHSSPHFNEDVVVLDVPLTKKSFSCILSDGSRVFLHSKAKSEIVVDNASTTSFCLLTKPLHELLRETEELQRIYSRDSSFPEENGTSGSSCEEKQLWVDKFSPKSFTQVTIKLSSI